MRCGCSRPPTAAPSTILSLRRSVRHPAHHIPALSIPPPIHDAPSINFLFLILQHHSLSHTVILQILQYHRTLSPLTLPHLPFRGTQSIHTSRFSVSLLLLGALTALRCCPVPRVRRSPKFDSSLALHWNALSPWIARRNGCVGALEHLRVYIGTAVRFIAGGGAHSKLWKSFHWTLQDTN